MADEFQTSGNWWDSSRASRFEAGTATSPSSSALNSLSSFGWSNNNSSGDNTNPNNMVDHIKSRASMDSASVSGSSVMAFGDGLKLHGGASDNNSGDANLHMMGLGLSSSQPMDWNHPLFRGEKPAPEGSFRAILQDNMGSNLANFQPQDHPTAQIQWRSSSSDNKLFHGDHHHHHLHHSSSPPNQHHHHNQHEQFKQITNNRGFSLDQTQFSPQYSSGESTVTCQQGLPNNNNNNSNNTNPSFDSALYGSSSTILQGLFGPDVTTQQQPYNSANFGLNSNEVLPSSNWSSGVTTSNNSASNNKLPQFLRSTNSPPKVPAYSNSNTNNNHLQFSNNAAFWNAPETAMKEVRAGFFPALQPQFPTSTFDEKPKNISEVRDSGSVAKKSGSEVASNKRSRNDQTPSTLPAFKVRKEKMGDRITALQQLVSPFGKTDTASVLSEAIEYIKFLHEQVSVLSTPYMKSGAAIQHQQGVGREEDLPTILVHAYSFKIKSMQYICSNVASNPDKLKDTEDSKQDLRSRGLCLVPVSSTFPVTHETTVDFWTPTFGGTFR